MYCSWIFIFVFPPKAAAARVEEEVRTILRENMGVSVRAPARGESRSACVIQLFSRCCGGRQCGAERI